jgi:hypothetical protein
MKLLVRPSDMLLERASSAAAGADISHSRNFQKCRESFNASFSNEFEIVGCVPLALVRPKFWPSFRFHYRWDSGLACATNLYCVHDLRCVHF